MYTNRAMGLIRLLSVGLRALMLLEFGVRRRLAGGKKKLAGLYAAIPSEQPPALRWKPF